MNRQIVELGLKMIAHLLEEVVPPAERANVQRKLKRMSAELMRFYETIDAATPEPTILDALRADDERARANLAGIAALVLDGGASHPQLLEVIPRAPPEPGAARSAPHQRPAEPAPRPAAVAG